jgi:tripartite-type tricarboxylate transporter receptor subunit TctC
LVADASEVIAITSKVRANNLQMLARALNIKMVHVPFRGFMEGMREMAASNDQMSIATQPNIAPFMDSNNLIRIIAVAGPKRLSSLPNVPTTGGVRVPGG